MSLPTVVSGYLASEPQLAYDLHGLPVCNLAIVETPGTRLEGQCERWYLAVLRGYVALERASRLRKGDQVTATGGLLCDQYGNPRTWNRADGAPCVLYLLEAQDADLMADPAPPGPDAGPVRT